MNDKSSSALPWYRHPWPWILMAGPFIVVVAGVVTAVLAFRSNDGLVADDYYKQGLAINQTTARDQSAVRNGFRAELMLGGQEVRVMLAANDGVALPETPTLRVMHPTRSGEDQTLVLHRLAAGVYAAKLSAPLAGRWKVSLEDEKREWRLTGEWVVEKAPVLRLP